MLFNWDATQFIVDENSEFFVVVKKHDIPNEFPITRRSNGGLGFAVKLYHFRNANDTAGPALWVRIL